MAFSFFRVITRAKYRPLMSQFIPLKSTLSRFFPSKLRPRYSIVGNEVVWQLPFDGFVLKKTYKIKWKLRVDRGVTSGTQLPFILRVGSNMQDLIVTVL
jgi:hypothetical protein